MRSASTLSANGHVLAWYCIDTLLQTIHKQAAKGKGKATTPESLAPDGDETRAHRLHLMLVSSVSAVPLALLSKVLDEIRGIIVDGRTRTSGDGLEEKRELVEALFGEIMEKVGDREKEFVIRWWQAHEDEFRFLDGKTSQSERGFALEAARL